MSQGAMRFRAASTDGVLALVIRDLAAAIGYVDCGFAGVDPFSQYACELKMRADLCPTLADTYRSFANRADPRATAPWAETIVVCIRQYGKYRIPRQPVGHIGRNYLADRRQPGSPDQQMPQKMTAGLKRLGLRVKRGGVPDRAAALRAGVVAIGRNGFAYAPRYGSWINIETWRINVRLPSAAPLPCPCPADCSACMKACPTAAIIEPFRMRMDCCIAHLTYGAVEPVEEALWLRMGPWIYGCDACQDVCPLNLGRWSEDLPATWLDGCAENLTPVALAEMTVETYLRIIHPLFWYIPADEAGLNRWRRNARRALAYERPVRKLAERGLTEITHLPGPEL